MRIRCISRRTFTPTFIPLSCGGFCTGENLGNVDRALTVHQQAMLDAPSSAKEHQQTVYDLNENKSPGLDGFTAEFYKKF